jgi:hypothetical protein
MCFGWFVCLTAFGSQSTNFIFAPHNIIYYFVTGLEALQILGVEMSSCDPLEDKILFRVEGLFVPHPVADLDFVLVFNRWA